MVRAALVFGTGSIGMRHLRTLGRLGIEAIARPTRATRALDADLAGVCVVSSLAEASRRGADTVIVATNTGRHVADAGEAIRAGFHVLVEKPLAADARGLGDLARAADVAGRLVFVGCCMRFHAGLSAFRDKLPAIGDVHEVRIECQSFLPDWRPSTDLRASYSARADEGGVLRDLIHEIDYAVWLFGRPSRVTCRMGNTGRLGIEAEEWADLTWETERATVVTLRLDYLSRPSRRRMRAAGREGTLEVDLLAQKVTLAGPSGSESWDTPQDRDDMMAAQASAFFAAVERKPSGALASFEDGAFAVALGDAARASSRSGQAESIVAWGGSP